MSDAPYNPYANPASSARPLGPAEEKQYSLLTHLLSIFFGFVPALVFFVLFRDRGPFVRAHTITEWNFQLTVLIVQAIGMILAFGSVLSSFAGLATNPNTAGPNVGLFLGGYVLILIVRMIAAIFGIVASIAASRGRYYRYPLAFRFVKLGVPA